MKHLSIPRLVALALAVAGLLLVPALPAWAQAKVQCDTKSTLANLQKAPALSAPLLASARTCGSLLNVLTRLAGHSTAGGKKLENDKPLNVAAAQRERQAAMADAEFAAALKDLLAGETEPLRQLVLEAALLDEYGYYAARDLLVRDARALAGQ